MTIICVVSESNFSHGVLGSYGSLLGRLYEMGLYEMAADDSAIKRKWYYQVKAYIHFLLLYLSYSL